MKTKIYRINCEWDMGFHDAYSTKEKAQKDIDNADWESCETTLEEAQSEGMVGIEEIDVY